MTIIYVYFKNPLVHGIYIRKTRTLYISTNAKSAEGVIFLRHKI